MAFVVGKKFWQRKPVKRGIAYSDYALERMRQLELQPWVRAEIMEINANELEEVHSPNPLEGYVAGHPNVMWRRAVRRKDIQSYLGYEAESDDELSDACNYVSVYRWATDDEAIRYELEGDTLLVVSVMTNLELARYIDTGNPE